MQLLWTLNFFNYSNLNGPKHVLKPLRCSVATEERWKNTSNKEKYSPEVLSNVIICSQTMYFAKVEHIYLNLKRFVSLSFHILISIALCVCALFSVVLLFKAFETHERLTELQNGNSTALDHIVAVYYFWLRKLKLYLPSTKTQLLFVRHFYFRFNFLNAKHNFCLQFHRTIKIL